MDWGRIFKRVGRTIVQVGVAGLAIHYSGQAEYAALVPSLAGLGKLIREKWNWSWLPF